MSRYADGDAEAFVVVFREVALRLRPWFLLRTRSHEDTEDLVQQVLMHMHRARGRFVRGARVTPWAFAIGANLLKDRHRRASRQAGVLSDAEIPASAWDPAAVSAEDLLSAQELVDALEQALLELPDSQRDVYRMVKLSGLSHDEVAEMTGNSASGVKALAHRAAVTVRAILGPFMGG